jgi:hypothetical protein
MNPYKGFNSDAESIQRKFVSYVSSKQKNAGHSNLAADKLSIDFGDKWHLQTPLNRLELSPL